MDGQDRRTEADRLLSEVMPGPLAEAVGAFHEMYLNLKAGGFTERQALWIIGYVLSGGSTPPEDE